MAEIEVPNPDELHERGETTFGRRAALTTAIYAVVLSLASLGGNNTVKEMLLAQQQSSDQWAFYQAKVIREHQYRAQKMLLETQLAEPSSLKGAERAKVEALATKFAEEEKRYNAEKKDIEKDARKLEKDRAHHRDRRLHRLGAGLVGARAAGGTRHLQRTVSRPRRRREDARRRTRPGRDPNQRDAARPHRHRQGP